MMLHCCYTATITIRKGAEMRARLPAVTYHKAHFMIAISSMTSNAMEDVGVVAQASGFRPLNKGREYI